MIESLAEIFSGNGFPARWNCGPGWQQEPWWGWMNIVGDVLIWLAYFAIPIILISFTRKRRDLPFMRIFYLFAAFILACGSTHLLDALIFYWPVYRLLGIFKLTTAIISLSTAVSLLDLVPRALTLRSPKQSEEEVRRQTSELRALTQKLEEEVQKRQAMYEELRDSREMLQLAMAAGEAGFFNWDFSSDLVTFDHAEVRLTGMGDGTGAVKSGDFIARIEPEYQNRVRDSIEEAIQGQSEYDVRFPFIKPSGEKIWLAGRGCVIRDSDGKAQRFIGINHDVTDQIHREQKLDETAKLATSASEQKSRFVAQVSHEIRTPLAAMLGCIDSLVPNLPAGDTRNTLRIVRSQGEMLRILVNDVLDLSKIEAGRLELEPATVEITRIFADVVSLMDPLATEKGLVLEWRSESTLPRQFTCDPYRLKQILINLIGNAIKFTSKGSICIATFVERQEVTGEGNLVIQVRDTGSGIPQDKLPIIFQEYEQAAENHVLGTGLGLAICDRLVSLMNGRITVESTLGVGSTFDVRLPLGNMAQYDWITPVTLTAPNLELENVSITSNKRLPLRVLAAEDTRAIQFVLNRVVGQMVDSLVVVDNGLRAIEEITRAGISDGYDLVMMDIQMPEMDGIQATQQLRASGFNKPIVALSAGAMEGERKLCLSAGCTFFLAKPIDVGQLRVILQQIVESNLAGAMASK